VERKGDDAAFVDIRGGGPIPQARVVITLDGYSAPLTAGNFACNVQNSVYNGVPVNASYASVLAGRGAVPGTPREPGDGEVCGIHGQHLSKGVTPEE